MLFDGAPLTDIPTPEPVRDAPPALPSTPLPIQITALPPDDPAALPQPLDRGDSVSHPADGRDVRSSDRDVTAGTRGDAAKERYNLDVLEADSLGAAARATLQQALDLVDRQLTQFVQAADYPSSMAVMFGAGRGIDFDAELALIKTEIETGTLGLTVKLVPGETLLGHPGAYAAVTADGVQQIYLNADWLANGASAESVARVLVEETGHAVDQRLNAGVDTTGDEGELFAERVMGPRTEGERPGVTREDDKAAVQIGGVSTLVEFADVFTSSIAAASDGYINSAEHAAGIRISIGSLSSALGTDVLVTFKDDGGNLLFWQIFKNAGSSTKTTIATPLGSYEGEVTVEVYEGKAASVANSGRYDGTSKAYPSSSAFNWHKDQGAVSASTAEDSNVGSFTVDLSVSAAPTTVAFAADTGSSDSDLVTRTVAQTITGTLSANLGAGEVVQVSLNNGSNWQTATAAAGSATYSLSGVTLTGNGTVVVRVQDAAGNTSTPLARAYVLDKTAPTKTVAAVSFSADTGSSTSDFLTNSPTQTITGTLSANLSSGEVVRVSLDDGATWQTANATVGTKAFSLAGVTLTRSDTLRVRVEDAAGNAGTAITRAYTLDTDAPAARVATAAFSSDTGSSSSDFVTRAASQTISGALSQNLASGEVVKLSLDNGATWRTATAAVGGSTYSVSGVPLSGSSTLVVRVEDAAGNASTEVRQAYVIDTTAPNAPALSVVPGAAYATAAEARAGAVTVTGEPGAAMTVTFANSGRTVTKTFTGTGNAQPVALTAEDLATLGDGTTSVTATQVDLAGNTQSGGSASATFVLDTAAPTNTVATVALSHDTGSSSSDAVTSTATQTVSGTLSANLANGEVVRVSLDSSATWQPATASVGSKTYSLSGVTLVPGVHALVVRVEDAAGNASAELTRPYVLDTVAPDALPLAVMTGGERATAAEAQAGVVSVTGENGGAITVTFANGARTVTKTLAGTGGAQTVALTAADVTTLGDGTITVKATQADLAGNAQTAAAVTTSFVLDTVAPAHATVGVVAGAELATAVEVEAGAVLVSGENGGTIAVNFSDGVRTIAKTYAATGSAQVAALSAAEVAMLADGPVTVTVSQTDAAGNPQTAAPATAAFVLDQTPPDSAVIGVVAGSEHATAAKAQAGAVTVSAEAGSAVAVTFANGARTVVKTMTATGAAQIVALAAADLTALGDGTVSVSATVTDVAGNVQTNQLAPARFVLDTQAPDAPALSVVSGAALASAAEAQSGAVTVAGEAGGRITVRFSNGTQVVTKSVTGTGFPQAVALSATDLAALGDGTIDVSATQIDRAGNAQATAASSASFVLDTVAPTSVAATVALSNDTGASSSDFTTKSASQTVSGTLSANLASGEVVRVSVDSGITWQPATAAVGGTTYALSGVTLVPGVHALVVRVEDAAGNASAELTRPYVLDTVAPDALPLAVMTGGERATAAEAQAGVVSVTGENGGAITVTFANGARTVTKTLAGTGGAQTVALTAADVTTLGDGTITVKATQADLAGNAQTAAAVTTSFVLDTVAPAAPTLTLTLASDTGQSAYDRVTADDMPTVRVALSGWGSTAPAAGDVVRVYSGGAVVGTATLTAANVSGGYVDATTAGFHADGAISLTATITDVAGNESAASGAVALTLDRAAPQVASAVASGNTIVLTYADAFDLDSWTGTPPSAYTVKVNGASASVGSAVVNGAAKTVTLYLGQTLVIGQNVTVSYADPSADNDAIATQDVAGNDAASFTDMRVSGLEDTIAPAAPTAALALASDTGQSAYDRVTADDTPTLRVTLSGTGATAPVAGDIVKIYSDGAVIGSATLTAANVTAGYAEVTTARFGADGVKSLTATVTDAAGNESIPSAALELTLDRVAPGVVSAMASGNAIVLKYADDQPLDGWTGTPSSAYTVKVNGNPVAVNSAVVNGAAKTVTLYVATPLWPGQNVTVSYVDPTGGNDAIATQDIAGNDAASFTSLAVGGLDDKVAPSAPGLTVTLASDTGQSAYDGLTADDTPTVRVTLTGNGATGAVAGDVIRIYAGDTIVGSVALSELDVSDGYVELTTSPLGADGMKTLTATLTDTAGNESAASQALSLTVDRAAPALLSAVASGNAVVLTYADSHDLDGWTGTPASAFTVKVDGSPVSVSAAVVNGPAKTVTVYLARMIAPGQNVTVSYTDSGAGDDAWATQDAAGNDAASFSDLPLTNLDRQAPAAPVLALSLVSDTGASSTDGLTRDDTPTLRITLRGEGASAPARGDVVTLYSGTMAVATIALTAEDVAAGFVDMTATALGDDGEKVLTARITDSAGNVSEPSGTVQVTLDRAATAAPDVALRPESDTGATSSDRVTADDTPTLRIDLSALVNGDDDDESDDEEDEEDEDDEDEDEDQDDDDRRDEEDDRDEDDEADGVHLQGGLQAGDRVNVYSNGVPVGTITLTASHIERGYVDVTTSTLGGDGVKAITATVTDRAGNESAPSDALALTLDRAAPILASASVDGRTVTLTYADQVDLDSKNKARTGVYTVNVNGVARSVSSLSVDADARTVTLTLSSAVQAGQAVTVSYTDRTSRDDTKVIQDLAGNDAQSVVNYAVTNVTGGGQDQLPVAVADSVSVDEDASGPAEGSVTANDTLGDGGAAQSTVTWGSETAQYGTITRNADGTYSYALNSMLPAVQRLSAGQTLIETFTYTLTDSDGDTSSATLTITIAGSNDAPRLALGGEGTGYGATFVEGGDPVPIAGPGIAITDADDTYIDSAAITLLNARPGDVLAASAVPAGITATVNGNVVTLAGAATLTDYQVAIRAITFTNSTQNPDTTPRTIAVVVSDGEVNSNAATAVIAVAGANDRPVADGDAVTTNEDTPVTINAASLLDNDSDLDGDVLTISAFTQPEHGTLVDNGDGTFTYSPDANYNGADTFTYTVSDGHGGTATATVSIEVVALNDLPTAIDVEASGGSSVKIDLLAADSDGTVSAFVVSSLPTHGTLYTDAAMTQAVQVGVDYPVSGNGLSLYFKPDTSWSGETSFHFTAKDDTGAVDPTPATATITVAATTGEVYEDGASRTPPQPESATRTLTGGGWTVATAPQYGTAVLGADGTWTYTVDNSNPAVQALGEGETLVDTFVVTTAGTLATTVQVGDGRSPLTSGHDQTSVLTLRSDFIAALQSGAAAEAKLALYTDFQKAPFTLPVPAGELNAGVEEQVEARIRVGSRTFIAVQANDGQDTWGLDAATGLLKAEVSFDGIREATYDSDARKWVVSPSGTTLKDVLEAGGSIPSQWTVVYDDNEGGPEQARLARFAFSVPGGQMQETITVTVHGTNDAPAATNDSLTISEDSQAILSVSDFGSYSDVDADSLAKIQVTALTGAGTLEYYNGTSWVEVTVSQELSVADINAGRLRFTPDADASGDAYVRIGFKVSDGSSYSGAYALTIDVTPVADSPALVAANVSGAEDGTLALDIAAALTDTDGSESLSSVTIAGVPAGASLSAGTDNGDGTWTVSVEDLEGLSFTPPANFSGTVNLTASVTSTDGADTETTTTAFTVTVAPIADTPVLTVQPASGSEDAPIALSIGASTPDAGAVLRVVISNIPSGAVLANTAGTLSVSNGAVTLTRDQLAGLTVTAPSNFDGHFNLTVTAVADDNGDIAETTETLAVTVTPVADAPTLTVSNVSGSEDTAIPLEISASTPDADETLTIRISNIPSGALLANSRGVLTPTDGVVRLTPDQLAGLTITPLPNFNGEFNLSVTAITNDDGEIAETDATVKVTVAAAGDLVAAADRFTVAEDGTLTGSVADTTTSGGTLTYAVNTGVAHGTLIFNSDGTFTYAPAGDFSGTDSFTYIVTDSASGESATQTVSISVTPMADAPAVAAADVTGTEDHPIALNITVAETDADGSETLSPVTIGGLPVGATLSAGTLNDNGTWTVGADRLAGLTLTPPADFHGTMALTASVTSTDGERTATTTAAFTVTVAPVVDAPTLTVLPAAGSEDEFIPLSIHAAATDAAEALQIRIGNIPSGAIVSNVDGPLAVTDGAVVLTPDALAGLAIKAPANFDGQIVLAVNATASIGAEASTTVKTVAVSVAPVGDTPVLSVDAPSGNGSGWIPLTIRATTPDADETLTITIRNIPSDTRVRSGNEPIPVINGAVTLTPDQLDALHIQPPADFDGQFNLSVTAIADDDGDRVHTSATLTITVQRPAPEPVVVTPPPVTPPPLTPPPVTPPPVNQPPVTPPPVTPPVTPPPAEPPPATPAPVVETPIATPPPALPLAVPPPVSAGVGTPGGTAAAGATIVVPVTVIAPPTASASTGMPASVLPSDGSHNTSTSPTGRINLLQGVPSGRTPAITQPTGNVQLESTDRGFNVIRTTAAQPAPAAAFNVPSATAATSSAAPAAGVPDRGAADGTAQGAATGGLDASQQRGADRLFVYQGISSAAAQPGRSFDFSVPREAFGHTNALAIVHLDAMRSDGQPLPGWLDFDPVSGRFSGKPPANADPVIEIKVVARDNEGREATTTFTIRVGDVAPRQGQPDRGAASDPIGDGERVADAGEEANDPRAPAEKARDGKDARREKARIAAPSFSEQLKRAAKDPLLSAIMDDSEASKNMQAPVRKA